MQIGETLQGRYRIEAELGEGGSATAYRAFDLLAEESVAIKLLREGRADLAETLRGEFERLRGLVHPALVRVRDLGTRLSPPRPYYVADLIEGQPLSSLSAKGWEDQLAPVADALGALAFLHDLGLAHGDLKPENIMVRDDGRGVLVDLGCAVPLGAPSNGGTPSFMAPELMAGGPTTRAAEIYAAGQTLARVLGKRRVPEPVQKVLRRCAAKDPARRPADAAELLEALGRPAPRALASGLAPRLIGRRAQLARFRELLDDLGHGRPGSRALVLHGADGSGRTRALHELKWLAQSRFAVAEGTARVSLARWLGPILEIASDAGLEELLVALASRREPLVAVLDDVHLLDGRERVRLAGLLRSLTREHNVLWLLASRPADPPLDGPAIETMAFEPLDEASVREWATELSAAAGSALWKASGGHPGYVRALLSRLRSGELRPSELERADLHTLAEGAWARLEQRERESLLWLAVLDVEVPEARWRGLGATDEAIASLCAQGWIKRDERGWQLARGVDAAALASLSEPAALARMHRQAALDAGSDALAALHLGRAGETNAVLSRMAGARVEEAPLAWAAAAAAIAERAVDAGARIALADVLQLAGRATASLSQLARAWRAAEGTLRAEAERVAGAAYLRLGRMLRAERMLRRALASGSTRALELLAKTLIQRGRYDEARQLGRDVPVELGAAERASLEESVGIASAYLGDTEAALQHLERAQALHPPSLRARSRIASYMAIAYYRAGRYQEAAEGYRRALVLAEEAGLDDQLASALSNLGGALQQLGDWGGALEHYERAAALASALGKRSTEASVLYNLSTLYAAAGLSERASLLLPRLRDVASRAGASLANAGADLLEGELALAAGELEDARGALERARERFAELGAERERAEAELGLAEVALIRGEQAETPRPSDSDLAARAQMLEARRWLSSDPSKAMALLERALEHADAAAHRDLAARIHAWLSRAAAAASAPELAGEHERAARAAWERIATTLPEHVRPAFWAHPDRQLAPAVEASPTSSSPSPLLRQVLEINRRLLSASSSQEVLSAALDAAISLSGAERGFVLLSRGGAPVVAAARNLDQERIQRSHLQFSHGIAEQVLASGEPVLSTDALADARFSGNESVHAMRLRAVACVPIGGPVRGAIYVDHRLDPGRFGSTALEILLAFASQVGIALGQAELRAALEERTHELEREKQKVEALAQKQADRIDRLEEQTRSQQEILTTRYEQSGLVARSPAMRALTALLDRVVGSSVAVLIHGESGSGKELISRCIHFNGPRREQPFVAINCAALPEALLESELFGHVRGAFSGASADHEGLFVRANGGTILLDELGETSAAMQSKLLRVIQEKQVRPVGANADRTVDFRLICATNRDLRREVSAGRFREDLFFRVAVVELEVPPLRDRMEDLPRLAETLLSNHAREQGREPPHLRPDALRALARHDWPGNVRELSNVLARAMVLSGRKELRAADLSLGTAARLPDRASSRDDFERQERAAIVRELEASRWNVSEVCRRLGIPRTTFYRKLARYGVHTE